MPKQVSKTLAQAWGEPALTVEVLRAMLGTLPGELKVYLSADSKMGALAPFEGEYALGKISDTGKLTDVSDDEQVSAAQVLVLIPGSRAGDKEV
jgi:hypothetical protein